MAAPRLVKTIRPGSFTALPSNLTAAGNTLFFLADDGSTGRSLWKSDGTSAGTVLVKDQLPGSLANPFALSAGEKIGTAVGNSLFYVANGGDVLSKSLWKSDGSSAGTIRITDPNFFIDLKPNISEAFGGKLFTGSFIRSAWRAAPIRMIC